MSPAVRPSVRGAFEAVRGHVGTRFGMAGVLWATVPVAVILMLAWWLGGAAGWRQGSAAPLILDGLAIAAVAALVASLLRLRRRWLDEASVAATMEEAAGLARGVVRGSLELSRSVPPGVSAALARRAEARVAGRLTSPTSVLAGSLHRRSGRWMRLGAGALVVACVPVISAWVASPERSRLAWSGLATPFGVMASPRYAPLAVRPGDIEVARGSDVAIEVETMGRLEVTLHSRAPGDVPRADTRRMPDSVATFRFNAVETAFEYWASAPDGSMSERYRVTPVDPLFVADLTLQLTFPPHTGRYAEEYRGSAPALSVPVGTRVRVEGRASRELQVASLAVEEPGGAAVALQVDGPRFHADWTPRVGGVYHWHLVDARGGGPEIPPVPLDITLVRDSVPAVAIVFPGRDTVLPLSMEQPLVVQAQDDYGLASVELVAYRVRSLGAPEDPVVRRMGMAGTRSALVRPLLDVSDWGLLAGDVVRYRARVLDNAPSPQIGESPEYVLRMPEASELRWQAQQMLEDAAAEVESLAEQAGEAAEETRELERRNQAELAEERRNPGRQGEEELSFEEQEELRQALEAQEELAAEVDSLRQELEEVSESMRQAGLPDPEFREEMEELQRLLEEMMPEELRERMEDMARNLEEMDEAASLEALERLAQDQEEMRQRLEESIERFRRAATEQELRAAEEEAAELARREDALADAMEEGDTLDLRARQQADLERQTEALLERMEEAREHLDDLGEQQAGDRAETAGERTDEARRDMAEAREQAEAGEAQSAAQEAREAAEALREAQEALAEARAEMTESMDAAAREALRQTAEDALSLARQQAALREQMRRANTEQQAAMRADEVSLLRGVRNMAENLSAGSRASGQVDRAVSTAIGEAMEAITETLEALDSRRGSTPSPTATAEAAVRALNQVALQAIAGAGQSGQDAASGGAGEMQEMLEAIAQRQGDLILQTEELMPMQLGEQALARQMQQLSQGQEAVAGELGDLAQQPNSEEQALGDLDELAQEAAALAEELAMERLRAETIERQEQLFQRLLDAGRSLERDEESEERESEVPGEFERNVVGPLSEEDLNALRFELPPADVLGRLPPAQRRLVIEYFERLNQAATTVPPGGGS